MLTTESQGMTGQVEVVLNPTDERFTRLIAGLGHKRGIYWLEYRGRVVKVGKSGEKRGNKSGLGHRLSEHVNKPHRDYPSHREGFPAWHCFVRVFLGRTVTIRWQECPFGPLSAIEKAAIAAADPLWENEKHWNGILKAQPERQPEFTARIIRIIDGWQA